MRRIRRKNKKNKTKLNKNNKKEVKKKITIIKILYRNIREKKKIKLRNYLTLFILKNFILIPMSLINYLIKFILKNNKNHFWVNKKWVQLFLNNIGINFLLTTSP